MSESTEYSIPMSDDLVAEGRVQFFSPEDLEVDDLSKVLKSPKDLLKKLKLMDEGDFLLEVEQFTALDETFGEVSSRFYAVEEFNAGRHKNSHGLVFGQLILDSLFERDKQIHIANKPFDTPKDATKEYVVSRYINGLGRPDTSGDDSSEPQRRTLTFNTLGFHRIPGTGQFGLVTEYDPSVVSFDNLFWDHEAEGVTDEQIERALARSAFALARLHVFGLSHGDAAIKNFASDNMGIRYIDLESARPLPRYSNGQIDELAAQQVMHSDMETLLWSLNTGIEDTPRDFGDQLMKAFDECYVPVINHPSSTVPRGARLTQEDIEYTIEQVRQMEQG